MEIKAFADEKIIWIGGKKAARVRRTEVTKVRGRKRRKAETIRRTKQQQQQQQQCLMWFLHLAKVSMRSAEMTSKICGNAPASLQVSHTDKNKKQTLKVYATHE